VGLGRLKARLNEERLELVANIFIAVLRPIDLTKSVNLEHHPAGKTKNETNQV
jgi:hypothetical protein